MKKVTNKAQLCTTNRKEIENRTKAGECSPSLATMLIVMADVLDLAAAGEDIFLTLGATRDKSGFLLTITWDKEKLYASGGSLMSLAEEASLLV